jgi:DNA polymerase-3 subunit beta
VKLTIDSSAITEAALFAAKAVGNRPTSPILSGLILTAEQDTLTIYGFDGDKSAQISVTADVYEPGRALIPSSQLTSILKVMPKNKPLDMEVTDRAHLKCGKSRFTVPTMPADQYPPLPGQPPVVGTIDSATFARGVALVIASVSKDDALRELTGIKVESEGGTLRFLATDRYRMSYAEMPWNPAPGQPDLDFLVHASTLDGVAKGSAGLLTLQLSEGRAGFTSGNRSTGSNVMAYKYPAVLKLFPAQEDGACTIARADLLASVSRASVVVEGKNPLRINFLESEIIIDAGGGEKSTGEEAVEATLDGQPRLMGFNPMYLMDALNALEAENVVIGLRDDPRYPVTVQGEGWDGPGVATRSRTILMPMKLQ